MAQLDRFMEVLNLNEEAMAAMFNHQQNVERTRKEQEIELKPMDDYVTLLRQCVTDLENRNARLQTTLGEVVLPVLELACHAQPSSTEAISSQLLAALVCTRQTLAESGSGGCSSGETSPACKAREDGAERPAACKDLVPKSAPPTCGKVLVPALQRDPALSPPLAAKMLSFGASRRPAAVVHVLAHDI